MARKLIVVLASSVAVVLVSGPSAVAELRTRDSDQRFIPGEALVRFEPGVVAAERREARDDAGVAFGESLLIPRVQLVKFRGSVQATVARLERQPGVAYAQPNFRYHALAAAPNDTHFGQLWGLGGTPGVGVLSAWDVTRGAGQIIAVGDTGLDLTHPDLVGRLWTGPGGIHGHDFVDDDNDPEDFQSHGTHVSGTAAATANNNTGVAGVAPEAQIMAVRVLDGDGGGGSGDIANGIAFAADNGAGVVNLSLGGSGNPSPDSVLGQAVTYAAARGTMIVAAAGNENNDNDVSPTTPCNLPQALADLRGRPGRRRRARQLLELRGHERGRGRTGRRPESGQLQADPELEAGMGDAVDQRELRGCVPPRRVEHEHQSARVGPGQRRVGGHEVRGRQSRCSVREQHRFVAPERGCQLRRP